MRMVRRRASAWRLRALALAGPGVVLVADDQNNVVWLINQSRRAITKYGRTIAAGRMAIVAGNTGRGFGGDGGPATKATLSFPESVVVDRAGNLYIADSDNNRVREVQVSNGTIRTVAGNGKNAFSGEGGPALTAAVNGPDGVAIDHAGNLYIADFGNDRVREVHAHTGIITTVAGNGDSDFSGDGGAATKAGLSPNDLAIDDAGNLYIIDGSRVREVHAGSGIITTVAGNGKNTSSGDGGPATKASLVPYGMAVDGAGNIYIAEYSQEYYSFNRVREVHTVSGIITTVAGNGGLGVSGAAVGFLNSMAVDGEGNLYIADGVLVLMVHARSGIITTVAGNGDFGFSGDGGPAAKAALSRIAGMAVDGAGNLYVADGVRVRVIRGVAVPLK